MRIYYSDQLEFPLPREHRFPLPKYALLRQNAQRDPLVGYANFIPATPVDDEQVLLVHTSEYWSRLKRGELTGKEMRRIGFPWSPELVNRVRYSAGGTYLAGKAAIEDGIAANLAGGTHHAYSDHGMGYCVLNDTAIATRALQALGLLKRVVILDLDVHQGNGTAAIFAGDASVFTLSVHGDKNFPFHKETSDLDIALPDETRDVEYLQAVASGVSQALSKSTPQLAFYIAGADPFEGDRLGRMCVSKKGLLERDRLVFEQCQAAQVPVAIVLGGGYVTHITDVVEIHLNTLRIALQSHNHRLGIHT
jgi:acetoin utilization deacetylase AcuC-like enzyme